ncbi:MAG: hemerythrin domain-containing protein [Planctomycetia bacterium]|nr:hemerythrin domain-containing protein [Planctomycetia bacterium]
MYSTDRIDPVILGHILGQHRELHSQLLSMRAEFTNPDLPDAQRLGAVREMLAGLRDYLRTHFEQEERGGFMEESIARMPRLSSAVQKVMADHPGLLAELDTLLETIGMRDISPETWAEATRGFAAFSDHLLVHERNENAVVQEGYNEDLDLAD